MENYSYPDSGDSSPRSREIEFENTPPWEDSQNPQANNKVKFMCSYGGKIHPRPHDNLLAYIGGETKILAVDRNIKFSNLISKLSALSDAESVSFKYQLPGEDLDALISVTSDDDLEHMMHEYDRLYRASPKPVRLRLFLFPVNPPSLPTVVGSRSFGSDRDEVIKSEKERFVEALNSGPIHTTTLPSVVVEAAQPPQARNVDFLFGLEKGMVPPLPVMAGKLSDPIVDHDHEIPVPGTDNRMMAASDPIQKHIQDPQRLRIEEQQGMYTRKSDDNLAGGYPVSAGSGEYYFQKGPEKVPQVTVQGTVGVPGYWSENPVGVGARNNLGTDQPVYMIQTPAGAYHAPMVRPGPATQGYYTVQRMPPELYREQQQMYNNVGPSSAPAKLAAYSDGYNMVRPATTGMMMDNNTGYVQQVAYDNGVGRQVYYTAQGGGVMTAPPPAQPQQSAQAQYQADVKAAAAAMNQEAGRVVPKTTQTSVLPDRVVPKTTQASV